MCHLLERLLALVLLQGLPQVQERMMRLVAAANRESFGFDLTEFAESAQVARYGAEREGHFDWHSDIGAGALAGTIELGSADPGSVQPLLAKHASCRELIARYEGRPS